MKDKKITLHAIGNDGNFNFYIFDKKQDAAEVLSKLFSKMGLYWDLYEVDTGKKFNIKNYKDSHMSAFGVKTNSRLDIFHGDKKMFVVLHIPEKQRLEFNEELDKISIIPKPKKIKKIKKKRW